MQILEYEKATPKPFLDIFFINFLTYKQNLTTLYLYVLPFLAGLIAVFCFRIASKLGTSANGPSTVRICILSGVAF
jgi:hypothetical protein